MKASLRATPSMCDDSGSVGVGSGYNQTIGEPQCSSSNRSRGHLRHHYIPSASPAFDPVGAKEVFMNQMSQEMEEVLSKTCSFLVASMTK